MDHEFTQWLACWMVLCGLVLNLWLALRLGRLLGCVVYAAVAAGSFVRFAWACGREHGFRPMPCPRWMYAPVVWGDMFVAMLGAPKGSVRHMGGTGTWNGVGDWTVFPKQEADKCV